MKEALIRMPFARITWICALFLLGYVGIEVALGGWIVKFMLEVRKGGDFASGMVATGYWMGITVGRVILGFVTPRIGEKLAIIVCAIPLFVYACLRDFRFILLSLWLLSLSSGLCHSSTSQLLQWPFKVFLWGPCFQRLLSWLQSYSLDICT